ncbi:MAG: putative phage abortive infection protein [Desulfuromonadales bacterium]|nr:putative phage abortive infection protein [Desulfuromonadales bacterium]
MNNEGKEKTNWCGLVILMLAVVALWYGFGQYAATMDKPGVYGDMHGAVNALFSGLAFTGVVFAIFMQKKELELQRKELRETQKIQENQRLEFEKQNVTIAIQRFENTFFQLLSRQNQIIADLEIGANSNKHMCGRDVLSFIYRRYYGTIMNTLKSKGGDISNVAFCCDIYMEVYGSFEDKLGPYFRGLYTLIKFVDQSEVEDKKLYTNIVRSQLSSSEISLMFYNCVTVLGRNKFKPMIERYSLLKNVSFEALLSAEHYGAYESTAY